MRLLHLLHLLHSHPTPSCPLSCPGPGICPPLLPSSSPINLTTWMSHLPPHTCLTTLSLPGTHDTLASPPPTTPLSPFTHTQSGSLHQQLHSGIRFLDLRARHYKNTFEMHHGAAYLHANFTSVIHTLHAFLSGPGRTEVVLVRLRDERWRPRHNTRSFAETLEWYIKSHPDTARLLERILYIPPQNETYRFPRLGPETRGKMVLIQDYDPDGAARRILGPDFRSSPRIMMQDYYNVTSSADVAAKWRRIVQLWVDHIPEQRRRVEDGEDCGELPLLVNFLSAGSVWKTPAAVALGKGGMNNRVQRFLRRRWQTGWDSAFRCFEYGVPELRGPTTGVVVWDFVNTKAARLIVSFNFRGDQRFDWGEVGYESSDETWSFRPWN